MNQVLSQAEVDALLSAVASGQAETAPAAGATDAAPAAGGAATALSGNTADSPFGKVEVVPYDLTNQDRVIRGRMPTLDIIYERFVRLFRMSRGDCVTPQTIFSLGDWF